MGYQVQHYLNLSLQDIAEISFRIDGLSIPPDMNALILYPLRNCIESVDSGPVR